MGRTARTIGFSVPPALADEIERIAAEEGRTKSELFRAMVRTYRNQRALVAGEDVAVYDVERPRALAPTLADLPELLSAVPHLGPEEAALFAADLDAARAEAGEATDPWAS